MSIRSVSQPRDCRSARSGDECHWQVTSPEHAPSPCPHARQGCNPLFQLREFPIVASIASRCRCCKINYWNSLSLSPVDPGLFNAGKNRSERSWPARDNRARRFTARPGPFPSPGTSGLTRRKEKFADVLRQASRMQIEVCYHVDGFTGREQLPGMLVVNLVAEPDHLVVG